MPSLKSDIYITVTVSEKSFSIGGVRLPDGKYKIKRGRSWSMKTPTATLSEIFTYARKWAVNNAR
jgi:hypothetical protein